MDEKDIQYLDENTIDFYGYKVLKTGQVINKYGKVLKKWKMAHEKSHVTIYIEGKHRKLRVARLVYYLFSTAPDFSDFWEIWKSCKDVIKYKDGDCTNAAYNNVLMICRMDYSREFNNPTQRKFTDAQAEQIRKEYRENSEHSYRTLCWKHGCSLGTMRKVLRDLY